MEGGTGEKCGDLHANGGGRGRAGESIGAGVPGGDEENWPGRIGSETVRLCMMRGREGRRRAPLVGIAGCSAGSGLLGLRECSDGGGDDGGIRGREPETETDAW